MTFRRIALLALASMPAVLGVACTDSVPSAPFVAAIDANAALSQGGMPGARSTNSSGTSQAALVWCQSHPQVVVSGDIGAAGGTIVVGNARLIIPAGAITQTVHFTATQPAGANSVVTFEPSGLEFRKPAGLQFDVASCNVGTFTPDVVYLNDEGVIVERIEATYSSYWRQVAAPINHFSSYALAF